MSRVVFNSRAISNTLATWCEELTHWKRPWYWERLRAGGEGDNRGWDGWMTSLTRWTWVWASFRSWWWTGKPGMLQYMGSQRVRYDWVTELTELRPDLPSHLKQTKYIKYRKQWFQDIPSGKEGYHSLRIRYKWGECYDCATLVPWENFQEEQRGKIQIKLSRSSEVMHLRFWKSKIPTVGRAGYRKVKCCLEREL